MSNSLRLYGLQHTKLPCPSPTPELAQTHVHWVSDAIQQSNPLSSPSPPALNLSQHQGFSQWVSSSHQVAKILEFQLQHQFFQWSQDSVLPMNGQAYRICIMESTIPTSMDYCEVMWNTERNCHSVWLWVGLRGKREYVLHFSFISTSIY